MIATDEDCSSNEKEQNGGLCDIQVLRMAMFGDAPNSLSCKYYKEHNGVNIIQMFTIIGDLKIYETIMIIYKTMPQKNTFYAVELKTPPLFIKIWLCIGNGSLLENAVS